MMPSPAIHANPEILANKLEVPPLGSRSVQRNRLTRLLQNGLGCRITLVIAPAGYGKTTLLSEWIAFLGTIQKLATYLCLDRYDNTLPRFWAGVTASLLKVCPKLSSGATKFLWDEQSSGDFSVLNPMLNEIASIPQSICLVLDDFHTITDAEILASVSYLVDHLPANLSIILSSRAYPPLQTARLRAHRQVFEVNAVDLAFTYSEVSKYVSVGLGLNLPPAQIQNLLDETEGWVAGLQLQASPLQKLSDFSTRSIGNTRYTQYLLDYFSEEVLDRQPPQVQEFLLKTSFLKELTPELCDAVLEKKESRSILKHLRLSNLFLVCLDEQDQRYRYHRLFANALQTRLLNLDPGLVPLLHKRACDWLQAHGDTEQAIVHALEADDLDLAVEIIETCSKGRLISFSDPYLEKWISHISDEMVVQHPRLGIDKAINAYRSCSLEETNACIRMLEEVLDTAAASNSPYPKEEFMRWELRAIKAQVASLSARPADTIQEYLALLKTPPPEDTFFLGATSHLLGCEYELSGQLGLAVDYFHQSSQYAQGHGLSAQYVYSACRTSKIRKLQGNLKDSEIEYERILNYTREMNLDPFIPLSGLLDIAVDQQELDKAERWISEIFENLSRIEKNPSAFTEYETILTSLGRYYLSRGDHENANKYLASAVKSIQSKVYHSEFPYYQILNLQAQVFFSAGELASQAEMLRKEAEKLPRNGLCLCARLALEIRIELANGRAGTALDLLATLESTLIEIGAAEWLIECYLLQALAYQSSQACTDGMERLGKAIRMATSEGYVAPFLNLGQSGKSLLTCYLEQLQPEGGEDGTPGLRSYAEKLLLTFDAQRTNPRLNPPTALQKLSTVGSREEPLSSREIEVLAHLVKGKSRKEIAATLMISENTLKTHTRRIFQKLGTHNRTVLLQHAMELGLRLD